jgi:AcrR family transcriptional regulator
MELVNDPSLIPMSRPTTKLEQIERTAIRLIAKHGLVAVTIKDIAREAHCSEGALYKHFSSKEEMAWKLFKREVEKFSGRIRDVFFTTDSFAKRLRAGIQLFYQFLEDDPLTFTFILLTQHDFPADQKLDPDLNPDQIVLRFIKQGMADKEFHIRDAQLGTAMILGLVLEPATHFVKGTLKGSMKARTKDVTDACLRVLGS